MSQENPNASAFEIRVAHRLEHVAAYVRDFQRGKPSSSLLPLWNLRALQDESRQIGRQDISILCQRLEHRIMALQTGEWEDRDRLAAEIAAAGEDIQCRACALTATPETSAVETVVGVIGVSVA